MQEGQLLMTQVDRDRLVALKKTKKKLITQGEAAKELRLSIRQVQRLLEAVKERGDKAVVHRLRGKPSNRKIEEAIEKKAVQVLSMPVYEGFGPTLAAEYLGKKHGSEASKDGGERGRAQIVGAIGELGIVWIAVHSPQGKGREERHFGTAQGRLVKGMRVSGVKTI